MSCRPYERHMRVPEHRLMHIMPKRAQLENSLYFQNIAFKLISPCSATIICIMSIGWSSLFRKAEKNAKLKLMLLFIANLSFYAMVLVLRILLFYCESLWNKWR